MSPRFKVGVQLHPQHCTIDELRAAWEAARVRYAAVGAPLAATLDRGGA
jgi:hypothetical protein